MGIIILVYDCWPCEVLFIYILIFYVVHLPCKLTLGVLLCIFYNLICIFIRNVFQECFQPKHSNSMGPVLWLYNPVLSRNMLVGIALQMHWVFIMKTMSSSFLKTNLQELNQILIETPPVWKGSSKLFRNLQERGTKEYLLCRILALLLLCFYFVFTMKFFWFSTRDYSVAVLLVRIFVFSASVWAIFKKCTYG